jgi:hypothetical protein
MQAAQFVGVIARQAERSEGRVIGLIFHDHRHFFEQRADGRWQSFDLRFHHRVKHLSLLAMHEQS